MGRELTGDLRKRLEARVARLEAMRQKAIALEDELLANREPDPLDTGADRSAAGVLEAIAESELRDLRAIKAALARMDSGAYGVCISCEEPIDPGRLRAVPEATLCADCLAVRDGARP